MNMTDDQIQLEFIRQCRLCSGLGKERMKQTLDLFWIMRDTSEKTGMFKDKSIPAEGGSKRKTGSRK
jgi:hypothetical protein